MNLNFKYKNVIVHVVYVVALVVSCVIGYKAALSPTAAQSYASLRKQAEKNINNHGSVGMHALADEAAIQCEMQRIKDSLHE